MSDDSSSGRRFPRIGRSKTTGSSAMRSSPPDGGLDGLSDSPNPLIPPPSPGATPPKKTWERHYRSFLTRKQMGGGTSPDSAPSGSQHEDGTPKASPATVPRRVFFPGSKRLFRSTSKGGGSKDALDLSGLPPMPILSKSRSTEEAVRGGNMFASVFQKTDRQSIVHDTKSEPHRRSKSTDALDNTLRRGVDKSISPMTPESRKTMRLAQQQEDDLDEHPVHGGEAKRVTVSSLPKALSSSGHKTKEMKKAFTAFHNSSKFAPDSTSAYLGDDPSIRRNTYFAELNQGMVSSTSFAAFPQSERAGKGGRLASSRNSLSALDTVDEHVQIHKSIRMLREVRGPDKWETGRRYLIAPAALASIPNKVLSILSETNLILRDYTETPFGTVYLGRATVTYEGVNRKVSGWSSCTLVLRQNYLMEYDLDGDLHGRPRGFAHLQYARAYDHPDFADSLELEFYLSPCAKADQRVLFMRVESEEERDRWVMCLNDAANLNVRDFYDFEDETEFGRGRYAAVYPARRRTVQELTNHPSDPDLKKKASEYDCALKIVDKNEFWRRVVKGIERADTIVREVSVQATLTAQCSGLPGFLQLRSFFETSAHIVMEVELVQGKDLFRYVASKGCLEEKEAAEIMRELLTCLEAMRRIGLAHRDIKPANILMCDKEQDGVCMKLGDFGMSTFVGVDGLVRGRCGTPGYVAPEIFAAGVNKGYSNKVDIFSAGVTLYVMLCGYELFYGETDDQLIAANKEAAVEFQEEDWRNVSKEARDLVQRMIEADPSKRIDVKDALDHEWIQRHTNIDAQWSESIASSMDRMDLSVDDFPEGTACTIT